MIEKTINITTAEGLAGPTAAQVADIVAQHHAIVQLQRRDGLRVYAGSPGLMQTLRLQKGDEVTIKADGVDAQRVVDALVRVLQS